MNMINILLIEDNPLDARLIKELLRETDLFKYELHIEDRLKSGLERLQLNNIDIVLLDLNLPDSNGQTTFESLQRMFPDLPVLLISGLADEDLAIKLIKLGAEDYLQKFNLNIFTLERSIRYSIERSKQRNIIKSELTARIKAENERQESEKKFRNLLEYTPLPICYINKDKVIIYRNERFFKIFGYTFDEVPSLTEWWLKAYPDAIYREWVVQNWTLAIKHAAETGTDIESTEYHVTCKDGSLREIIISVTTIDDNFLATFIDITERKKSEESVRESEEKFRTIYESSNDAIMLVNNLGYIDCNQKTLTMFGIDSKEEFIKLHPADISPPDQPDGRNSVEAANENIHKAFQRGMNHFDWIHRRSNGENFPAEVHLSAFYLDGKQLLQATVRDVTARQRAEEVLIKGKEKAEELNKLKSNFLANMSHELRTPLISVLGFAEILEDELHDNFELGAMAATIKSGGRRLLKTLNFILDISILESGKIKTNIYESDIVSLIKVAFDSFSSTATQKGLTYSFNPSQKEIISVIDPVLFNSILENLLNNAFKFTTKGEVSVNVYIKAEKAIIEVIDTGIGISNEEQQIIWDEFRQASEGISRNYEGIGLGLTIVKKYTALMGGTISVGSIVGEGSNFTIEFPIAKAIVKATQEQVPDSLRNSEMNPLLRIKNSQR